MPSARASGRAVILAAIAISRVARGEADAPPAQKYRLEYQRQEGADACPPADLIEAGVAARLGYEPFDAHARRVIQTTVRATDGAIEATLQMIDDDGQLTAERRLVSHQRDCAELGSAIELTISIAIDPFHGAPRPPPVPARVTPAPTVSSPLPAPSPPPPTIIFVKEPAPPPPPASPPVRPEFEVGVIGGIGTAPTRSTGVSASGGVRRDDLSIALEGRVDLPAVVPAKTGDIRASLLVASVVPCLHLRAFGVCAVATAGGLRAEGRGLVNERQVTIPYLAVAARARVALPIGGRWALIGHADLGAPLVETQLRVGGEAIWTSPPVVFAAGLRLGVRFP